VYLISALPFKAEKKKKRTFEAVEKRETTQGSGQLSSTI
jgi:hypothetical protein